MQEKFDILKEKIEKANNIVLINHIRMDPDAFGSLGAFYFILKENLNKNIIAINDETLPESFNFYNTGEIIQNNINLKDFNPDLIISFDAASTGQLGNTYIKNEKIFKNTDFIVIDHHMTNPGFGSINIIDTDSSSTCELVVEILEYFNWDKYITPKIATILTGGIHTDTNIFYNSNTTAKTLKTAAKLMELGADFRSTMYNFFQKTSFEKSKLFAKVLNNLKKENNGKIIYSIIKEKDFLETNTTDDMTSGFINRFINIEGCEVAFIAYEMKNGGVKTSFRSKDFSVGDFCASFPGGGGHKLAAGFKSEKDIDKLTSEILEKLKKESI